MEGNHVIYDRGKSIGQAQVVRQGLYYHFVCQCSYNQNSVCKLMCRSDEKTLVVGVMVPEKDFFVLDKRLAVKQFGKEEPYFYIENEERQDGGVFVPISAEEPFVYLARLSNAYLSYRNGKPGAWFPEIQ